MPNRQQSEPCLEVEYEVTECTPRAAREALARIAGARIGDTVFLYSDGVVTLGRELTTEEARAVIPHLLTLSPAGVAPPSLARLVPQPSRAPLRLVR